MNVPADEREKDCERGQERLRVRRGRQRLLKTKKIPNVKAERVSATRYHSHGGFGNYTELQGREKKTKGRHRFEPPTSCVFVVDNRKSQELWPLAIYPSHGRVGRF